MIGIKWGIVLSINYWCWYLLFVNVLNCLKGFNNLRPAIGYVFPAEYS